MSNEDILRRAIKLPKKRAYRGSVPSVPRTDISYEPPVIRGADIVHAGSEGIDYADIKSVRSKQDRRADYDLDQWSSRDFCLFIREFHWKKVGDDWELNWLASCQEVLKVKDYISDRYGFCDNVILKDYIEFFFSHYFDELYAWKNIFYISYLTRDAAIEKFFSTYDYATSVQNLHISKKSAPPVKKTNKIRLSDEAIEIAFLLSDEAFISDYGVIITVNWLIGRRSFTNKDAARYVYVACCKLHKAGSIISVQKSTTAFSPYPSWLPFQKAIQLIQKVDKQLLLQFEFIDSDLKEFNFLRS
jgi:hypothetical protein